MKKNFTLLFFAFVSLAFSQAGAPATPYYNGFNWTLTGMNLKNALATKITTTHTTTLTYSQVWEALKIVDLDPANSSNVLLVYGWENGSDGDVTNDRSRNKNSNGGAVGDWNREHVFAQSLGNPDLGSSGPGADAQMLRSSDVQRNGTRGNRLFASGSGINSFTVGTNGWYPGNEWKGDVARIVMYMYLRYGSQCLPTYVTIGSTNATDSNMVDLLLQWNSEDPVSQYEDNRNTYLGNASNTYGQGNRNPFIDNPYLATVIWGGPVAENRWPAIFLSAEDFVSVENATVYPNPAINNEVYVSTATELKSIVLYNINGQIIQEIKNPSKVNDAYKVSDLPKGFYLMQLATENASTTKKIIVN